MTITILSPQRFVALLALLLALASSVASAQTLREAVAAAVGTNPEVLATVSRRQAAAADVDVARGGFFPRVDLEGSYGRERLNNTLSRALGRSEDTLERRNASLTISQMLFDGFAASSAVDRQRARHQSSGLRVASVSEDIALRVVATYLEVLRRRDSVRAANDNYAAHERIFELIRQRTTSGVGRRADAAQADSRLALARAALDAENGSLRSAAIQFQRLVGRAPETLERPQAPREQMPPSVSEAVARASALSPVVRAAHAEVAAALADREVARAAYMPRVDLELGTSRDYSKVIGSVQDTTAALVLRYNLLRGGSDAAQVRSATHAIEEARQLLARAEREIDESVALAYSAYATARSRNEALARFVSSAEETRKAYATQFTIGQRTLLDLLNAENEYFNAELARLEGQYAEAAQVYRALAAIGILNRTLQVETQCCGPTSEAPVPAGEPRTGATPGWMLQPQ